MSRRLAESPTRMWFAVSVFVLSRSQRSLAQEGVRASSSAPATYAKKGGANYPDIESDNLQFKSISIATAGQSIGPLYPSPTMNCLAYFFTPPQPPLSIHHRSIRISPANNTSCIQSQKFEKISKFSYMKVETTGKTERKQFFFLLLLRDQSNSNR